MEATPIKPKTPPLSRNVILRVTLALVAVELSASRGRSAAALGRLGGNEAMRLDEGGLDLDSLERMDAGSALSEFFHLHEYGAEDDLLVLPSMGEWCDLVEWSLSGTGERLTFRTSGSTGEPKRCTSVLADLLAEAAGSVRYFGAVPRIVALTPAHHIYGAMFLALLPGALGPDGVVEAMAGVEAVRRAPRAAGDAGRGRTTDASSASPPSSTRPAGNAWR